MSDLTKPLANSISLTLKNTFAARENVMQGSTGVFTLSEDENHFFLLRYSRRTDLGEAYNTMKVAKYAIPADSIPTNFAEINDVLVRTDFGEDMLGPLDAAGSGTWGYVNPNVTANGTEVLGIQEIGSKLVVNHNIAYGALGLRPVTTFTFDSTDLNASQTAIDPTTTVEDDFALTEVGFCLGNMSKVDPEWQTFFNGEVFTGANQTAVTTNWSKGPSVTTFSASELVTTALDTEDLVSFGNSPLLFWPVFTDDENGDSKGFFDKTLFTPAFRQQIINEAGNFFNTALEQNVGYDNGSGVLSKNTYWNRTSKVICTFVVPNTRSLAVCTIIRGGTREALYTDAPTQPFAFETEYVGGETLALRDVNGDLIPILDEFGNRQPPIEGFVYKAERWKYDRVLEDYVIDGPTGGDSSGIDDDRRFSIHLFDLADVQEVKDGIRKPWNLEPYNQQLFSQPHGFTSIHKEGAIPECGDFKKSTNELFLAYNGEYGASAISFYPLFNTFTVAANTDVNPTSTATLRISGIPNGLASVKIWSEFSGELIFEGDVSFSNGTGTTPVLSISNNSLFFARWLGANPPTTGAGMYGVTT